MSQNEILNNLHRFNAAQSKRGRARRRTRKKKKKEMIVGPAKNIEGWEKKAGRGSERRETDPSFYCSYIYVCNNEQHS